jgi:hypothetical protein
MYFKKNLRILVNGQAMATWPDALKIAKMAKNSHLWTHCPKLTNQLLALLNKNGMKLKNKHFQLVCYHFQLPQGLGQIQQEVVQMQIRLHPYFKLSNVLIYLGANDK